MEIASTEGRAVPVSGVTSVTTTVGHQGVKFPLEEYTNVTQLFVGPAVESVPITLNVGGVEKTITLLRSRTKDKVILRSEPDSIVFFNFTFSLGKNQHNVNYKVQFENAKNIREIADSFSVAEALLTYLYVLSWESTIGDKGDKMRLFLTDEGYRKALENQDKGYIKIKNHAKVADGHLHYDRRDRDL